MHESVDAIAALLEHRRCVVLTGAGISTDSGIPDYRSPGRPVRQPMWHRSFVTSEAARRRYWARSFVGWPRLADAAPNAAHRALAALERAGAIEGLITQNVDGLHGVAGSRRVVELHGALRDVCCLACGLREPRADVQARLARLNAELAGRPDVRALADGDADVPDAVADALGVPACLACGGVLKPDVVFFGDNVRPAVLAEAWSLFDTAERLLVVGSSLTVFSGYRFVRRAVERDVPVVIVNRGPTRGDGEAALKLDAAIGEILPALAARLA